MKEFLKQEKNKWILLGGILLLTFLLYGRVLNNGFAVDDFPAIVNNDLVQEGVGGISEIFQESFYYGYDQRKEANEYRPITSSFYALEVSLFGEKPMGYHAGSLLLYGLLLWVLFLFLSRLLSWHYAAAGTMLYALIPVHSEVVANIKAQDDLLMAFFLFLSFYAWTRKEERGFLITAIVGYLLAVLSKESAVPMLLVFPALDMLRQQKLDKKAALFLAPGIVYLLVRSSVIEGVAKVDVVNNALAFSSGYAEQSAMGFALFVEYIWLLLAPYSLSWDYSFNHFELHGWMHWESILGLLLFAGAAVLILKKFRKPDLLVWSIFFFLLSIFLYLHLLFLLEATFAERFLFLPSFAFVIMLLEAQKKWNVLKWAFAVVAIFWSVVVWNRAGDWKDNLTLFEADIEKVPKSIRANSALAFALYEQAIATEEADQPTLERAAELYRNAINIYGNDASTWYNFGMCNLAMGDYTMAELCFKDCLRLKPNHTLAFNNLGNIQYLKGEHELAKSYYSLAIQADSKNAEAWSNLGAEYLLFKQNDSAYYALEVAVQLDPKNENAAYNRDIAKKRLGIQ